MRVLLDAKDLIDLVEHSKPVRILEFDTWLRNHNSSLVYSLCNIRALAGPLAGSALQMPRIQLYLDQLEKLPHCYISADIGLMEMKSALRCFEAAAEYQPIDPFVPRFDQVLSPFAKPGKLNYPLAEIVDDLWRTYPQIFGLQTKAFSWQKSALSMDRQKPSTKRAMIAQSPFEPIRDYLMLKFSATPDRAAEVASWVAATPRRCPGLWFIRTVGAAMSQNRTYVARQDDTFDMAEMMAIPYVDVATMDRTTLDYLSRAVRSVNQIGGAKQAAIVFRNLKSLMEAPLGDVVSASSSQ